MLIVRILDFSNSLLSLWDGIMTACNLVNEMRDTFMRSVELLDVEITQEDELEKQKEEVRSKIEQLRPEQLAMVQELVRNLTDC